VVVVRVVPAGAVALVDGPPGRAAHALGNAAVRLEKALVTA